MIRKIIHIDMDAFFASIEQRDDPTLLKKPIVVAGSPESRGVVAAASYEARRFGIRSAMPTRRALSLCRNLIVVEPHFDKYISVSREILSILREYTDLIEPVSLDESYLDVIENKKRIETATEIAIQIKAGIKLKLGLTASAGVAPNKLLAKIGSDMNKPDGLFVIKPHRVDDFIKGLDVAKLWGVGEVTCKSLREMGVATCEDLQRFTENDLAARFGKFGKTLFLFARGIDDRPVVTDHEIKSLGSETTFPSDSTD